jgi:galactokinase
MATVPIIQTLAEIYPEDALAEQTERWNRLLSEFTAKYGKLPDFVARSPGRVNIIGEVS